LKIETRESQLTSLVEKDVKATYGNESDGLANNSDAKTTRDRSSSIKKFDLGKINPIIRKLS
jgi:hypothetical protein